MVSILSKKLKGLKPAILAGGEREKLLNRWFQTHLGKQLILEQSECIQSIMKSKFGQHLIQVDSGYYKPLVKNPPVGCMSLLSLESNLAACPVIQGEPEKLPFCPDTVDHILLHHTLDFCENPYQVLRESQIALCAGGYLIIVGFNPNSWWGIRKLFTFGSKNLPWQGRFLSVNRVKDWLNLLDLEVEEHYSLVHSLPIAKPGLHEKFRWIDRLSQILLPKIGGCYILVAQKRVAGITMVGREWRNIKTNPAIQRANIRNKG